MQITEESRVDYKIAILRSGKHQFQIAALVGINEWKLSCFLNGRRGLQPGELARLRAVLGMEDESASVSA